LFTTNNPPDTNKCQWLAARSTQKGGGRKLLFKSSIHQSTQQKPTKEANRKSLQKAVKI
jgi:hypothetical protein